MAPSRTSTMKNPKARKSATSGPSTLKSKSTEKTLARRSSKQVKTKPLSSTSSSKPSKRKTKTYTDKELKLPTLNMITPASVQKPSGKKKGKIFVDDEESMMTILAMVNAEKEGQIESKIMKARQLEEVREARRKEAEKRSESKREVVAGKMKEMKKGRKGKGTADEQGDGADKQEARKGKSNKKRVSFA